MLDSLLRNLLGRGLHSVAYADDLLRLVERFNTISIEVVAAAALEIVAGLGDSVGIWLTGEKPT